MRSGLVLASCAVAVVIAALAGSLSTINAADQYAQLDQPGWAPPSWLFGPVWTLLYIGLALSGWGIWKARGFHADLGLWCMQLTLNALWSPLFFAMEARGIALAWILALDVMVLALIIRTWRLGWPAWLLVPYMAWITFATALNAAVWSLN